MTMTWKRLPLHKKLIGGRRTEGIKCTIRPGNGDLPVGQFDAQNLLPKGSGIPAEAIRIFEAVDISAFLPSLIL